MLQFIQQLGNASIPSFWLPVLVWTGLAGAVAIGLALARDLHPLAGYRLRQALLLALPASILAAPWLPRLSLPVIRAPGLEPLGGAATPLLDPITGSTPTGAVDGGLATAVVGTWAPDPLRGSDVDITASVLGVAVIALVLLATVRLLVLSGAMRRLRNLGNAAPRVDDPALDGILQELCGQLGVRRPIELREGPPGCVPMTFGGWRPIVVVPRELLGSPDSLRTVLMHELIHVRRGDAVWALLDCLVAAVFAFHPLVWLLRRGIQRCRETSCDAEVLRSGDVPVTRYAQLLVRTHAAHRIAMDGLTARMYAQPSSLKQRLETMRRLANSRRSARAHGGVAATAGFLFTGLALACGSATVGDARAPSPPRPATMPQLNTGEPSQPGDRFRDCGGCPELVVVPAGSFLMGSAASEEQRMDNEGPRRRVTIPSQLAVGVYEITFAQWDACVRGGGCLGYSPDDGGGGRGMLPVTNVSWEDAQAYVAWLSDETGEEYRLPSEAEWQYAARAGTSTARYWGESDAEQCRYANGADEALREADPDPPIAFCSDGYPETAPVGSFEPNGFGLHDVMGNVQEWTQDCWSWGYSGAPADGRPQETGDCSQRNLSGGSWALGPWHLRSASRFGARPAIRHHGFGFRVVRVLG